MTKKPRIKKCKICGTEFESKTLQHVVCCYNPCGVLFMANETDKRIKKEWAKEKKELKEKIKTHSDWLNDLQKLFNKFINLRDKGKPCISCGVDLTNKPVNASHYFSVGSSPSIRFDEDNCHSSCIKCNMNLHGNIAEYTLYLPLRIGYLRFEALQQKRNETVKLTIPEIKEKIEFYKQKIKLIS